MYFLSLQHLPRDLHVVCVDMPGHEGTSRTGAEDYSIQGQVTRVHQVCVCGVCVLYASHWGALCISMKLLIGA